MRKTETEKAMRKEERYKGVLNWFKENVPVAETELHYDDPYQLLIAVILSAQCTDKRVNMITPALFEAFPTPEVMAASTPEVVFEYIRSVSYPNNKAKHLVGMAKMLIEDFKGVVPSDIDELQKLPGVGRHAFHIAALPLGVYGIKGQAALARAGQAGKDDHAVARQGNADVFQVVLPRALYDDGIVHGRTSAVADERVQL